MCKSVVWYLVLYDYIGVIVCGCGSIEVNKWDFVCLIILREIKIYYDRGYVIRLDMK